jgi:hypothetical protein
VTWRILAALGIASISIGCSSNQHEKLERLCHEQARTIVLDRELWREWLTQARAQADDISRSFGEVSAVTGFEAVPGFEIRYGRELKIGRDYPPYTIRQEDIYLVKGRRIVAKFIDFIVRIRGIGSDTQSSCFGTYSDRYFGEHPTG